MNGRAEVADDAALVEHRRNHGYVEEMTGGEPRIIGDNDVALLEPALEHLDELAAGMGDAVDVTGRPGRRLHHQPALGVDQRSREVAGFAHDGAECDALQRLGLLAHRADQVAPEDFELDGIHGNASRVAIRLPVWSTVARQPGAST